MKIDLKRLLALVMALLLVLPALTLAEDDPVLELSWTLVAGADGYDIYCARYDSDTFEPYRSVDAVSGKIQLTGLAEHTAYKACVRAWKNGESGATYLGDISPVVYAITGGYNDRYCNAKSVNPGKNSVSLNTGDTHTLSATVEGVNPDRRVLNLENDLRFYTSDQNVATVDDSGQIKAKAPGTCAIYLLANNGVRARVRVRVK